MAATKATEKQAARIAELGDKEGRKIWAEPHQGKSIIDAFCRYLASDDPEKITAPLRHFLMMKCGFIAHFDLGGFRASYPNAYLLLEELDADNGLMRMLRRGQRPPESVYRDGMTDVEVCEEIASLAEQQTEHARRNFARAIGEKAAQQTIENAGLLKWVVIPQGFVAVQADAGAQADGDGPDPALQALAEARGMRLVPESRLF